MYRSHSLSAHRSLAILLIVFLTLIAGMGFITPQDTKSRTTTEYTSGMRLWEFFKDDFSTEKGWYTTPFINFSRNAAAQTLDWNVVASNDEIHWIPTDIRYGNIGFDVRIKANAFNHGSSIYFGLVENTSGAVQGTGIPPGVLFEFGRFTTSGGLFIGPYISYSDRLDVVRAIEGDTSSYISTELDTWYRVVLEMVEAVWTLKVYSSTSTLIGQVQGAMPAIHTVGYAAIFAPAISSGQVDDVRFYLPGSALDEPDATVFVYSDQFSMDNYWVDQSGGLIERDALNKNLSWRTEGVDEVYFKQLRQAPSLYSYRGNFIVRTRIKIDHWTGDGRLFFGMGTKETMGLCVNCPLGYFIELGYDDSLTNPYYLGVASVFVDTWIRSEQRLSYEINSWYTLKFRVTGAAWTVTLYEESTGITQVLSGTFPKTHQVFDYFSIWATYLPVASIGEGVIDDTVIAGTSVGWQRASDAHWMCMGPQDCPPDWSCSGGNRYSWNGYPDKMIERYITIHVACQTSQPPPNPWPPPPPGVRLPIITK